jgi:hypothetical protein
MRNAVFSWFFRRFISVFARPEHPAGPFLDDLQALDAATLDLLEDLLTRTNRFRLSMPTFQEMKPSPQRHQDSALQWRRMRKRRLIVARQVEPKATLSHHHWPAHCGHSTIIVKCEVTSSLGENATVT